MGTAISYLQIRVVKTSIFLLECQEQGTEGIVET